MGGSSTTQTQKAEPWGPTQGALKSGIGQAGDLFKSGGFEVQPYRGDWVADTSQVTQDARQGILGMVPGMSEQLGGATDFVSSVASGQNMDAQRQRVIDSIMPAINGSFAGSGMTGSSLHQQNLAQGLSKGMADAEQGFTQQALSAAQMLPGMTQAQTQPYATMMGIGSDIQNQEQAEIDANMQRDMLEQSSEATALKDYLGLISGIGGQFPTQTGTQMQNPGLLGYLGAGMQAASLFSDRRLKTDVKRVGQTDDGLPIYTYRYVSGGPVHMGVMADEAPAAAVSERAGYQTVDYGAL